MKSVTEHRMTELCDLARSTWQSWVRERLFEVPADGFFGLEMCLEVALAAAVRTQFSLAETRRVWSSVRESGAAQLLVRRAREQDPIERFDLVIDMKHGVIAVATDDASVGRAIRQDGLPQTVCVVPVATKLQSVKEGFATFGEDRVPGASRAGRPRKVSTNVVELGRR